MLRTMLAAGAMTTLAAVPVFLLSAQSVLIRQDLRFSEPQLGLLVSAFFAAAALTSVLVGPLADRLGRRTGTLLSGALSALSTGGIALAGVSYPVLLGLLVLCGVANAALQTTANITVARSVPPDRQGLAFGIKQSAVPVAILVGGLAVPSVGVLVGWRWTYAATAAAAVLVTLGGLRVARRPASAPPKDRDDVDPPPRGALVVSAVAMTMASAGLNSLGAFLPAWAFDVGLTPSTAGLLLAAGSALSVVARIFSGAAADRRDGRNLPVVTTQLAVGALGFLLLSADNVPALVGGSLIAFGIGWAWPGLLLFAVVRVGRDSPGTASGAVQAGAFTGGASGPVLFGLLVAATSYPTAWRTAAVILLVASLLLMLARRMFLADLVRRPPRRPPGTASPGS